MPPTPISIPSMAPVMVLPNAVLFPNGILPLRIFEPRYRAMLSYALEHDRMFSIALMKPGVTEAVTDDQFFHTAGIGMISASVTQADGTSNLMLQGLARVRIVGFSQEAPFRIAILRELSPGMSDPLAADAAAHELRAQCQAIRVDGAPLPEEFCETLSRIEDPDALANAVSHALIADGMERQSLLEELDATARLRLLGRLLRKNFTGA